MSYIFEEVGIIDRRRHNEINRAPKETLKRVQKPEIGVGVVTGIAVLELDEEIQITDDDVAGTPACAGTEDFEPAHAVPPTQGGQLRSMALDRRMHAR